MDDVTMTTRFLGTILVFAAVLRVARGITRFIDHWVERQDKKDEAALAQEEN